MGNRNMQRTIFPFLILFIIDNAEINIYTEMENTHSMKDDFTILRCPNVSRPNRRESEPPVGQQRGEKGPETCCDIKEANRCVTLLGHDMGVLCIPSGNQNWRAGNGP